MKPVSPVVKGLESEEVVYAKDQPQYRPLPALIVGEDNIAISKWRLSFLERLRVLFTGNIWFSQKTFGDPLQPQLPTTKLSDLVTVREP